MSYKCPNIGTYLVKILYYKYFCCFKRFLRPVNKEMLPNPTVRHFSQTCGELNDSWIVNKKTIEWDGETHTLLLVIV